MKKLCNCNSKWVNANKRVGSIENDWEDVQCIENYTDTMPLTCNTCNLFFWHNPQYENHMWDLKEMNS